MIHHLSSQELLDALDRALSEDRAGHLEACAACREAVADLDVTIGAVTGLGEVPEPSPLFWDHLGGRVRAAVSVEPMSSPAPWWRRRWAAGAALGTAVAIGALVVALRWTLVPGTVVDDAREALSRPVPDASVEEASWDGMAEMAAALSTDDVHWVMASAPGATTAVNELTPREREEFVRLLGLEMGGVE